MKSKATLLNVPFKHTTRHITYLSCSSIGQTTTYYGGKLWWQKKLANLLQKHYLAEENLANVVHSQTKNYENYIIWCNPNVNVQNEQLQCG